MTNDTQQCQELQGCSLAAEVVAAGVAEVWNVEGLEKLKLHFQLHEGKRKGKKTIKCVIHYLK